MKKLKLFLMAFFISGLMLGVNAQQDTIKHLIFSEHRSGDPFHTYLELANVGTETIDLSKVSIANVLNRTFTIDETGQWRIDAGSIADNLKVRLSGNLEAGETFVIINVSDRLSPTGFYPDHRVDLLPLADKIIYGDNGFGISEGVVIPEWEMWGFDSVTNRQFFWTWGNKPYVVYQHLDNGDSIFLDAAPLELDVNGKAIVGYPDVAGIPSGTRYYTLVRKASVTTGNMNWAISKGVSAEDSEWQVIPNQEITDRKSFTTVHTHGAFTLNVSSSVVDVDIPNATMTVPWGVYKGELLLDLLDIGPGQAWKYVMDADYTDSTHSIVQDGDMLTIYTTGNELTQTDFSLAVAAPAPDQATVYPRLTKLTGGYTMYDPATSQYVWNPNDRWVQVYHVTDGVPVMDTIGNVPYATRVDTLYRYLEKAPLANWEIIWHDGVVRADLQTGDKLKVTAEDDAKVKEYFIDVLDYAPSDNVELAAITWPDKSEFLEDWNNDTIPYFASNKTLYTVTVPYGTKSVPALVAHPVSINSKVTVKRAASLIGNLEQRTTVFTVTSESDTLSKEYAVTFILERDPSKVQIYEGTPFFSEVANHQRSAMYYLEIVNPGNVDMDLSEYLITRTDAVTPGDAIAEIALDPANITGTNYGARYRCYVPGYQFYDGDTASWLLAPRILTIDPNVDPIVKPGDVFVMSASWSDREQYYTDYLRSIVRKRWDQVPGVFSDVAPNLTLLPHASKDALWLFHIDNDSVLEGKKPVGDPADYTLVDVIGDPVADNFWMVAGKKFNNTWRGTIIAKPNIYTGSRTVLESSKRLGTHPDTSAWIAKQYGIELPGQDNIPDQIGTHIMEPVTIYKSTVSSKVYLVSDGYGAGQWIQGDFTSATVDIFTSNLDKADSAQTLSIHSAVDGSVKAGTTTVVANDTLVVASADSLSVTMYALINLPLDSDAVLTTEDATLTIEYSGATGSIKGVVYGSLLKDLISKINVPDLAVMNIINGNEELIPLQYMGNDLNKVDTKVGNDIYFEVTAQDNVTVITYKLEPATESNDAYVITVTLSCAVTSK